MLTNKWISTYVNANNSVASIQMLASSSWLTCKCTHIGLRWQACDYYALV